MNIQISILLIQDYNLHRTSFLRLPCNQGNEYLKVNYLLLINLYSFDSFVSYVKRVKDVTQSYEYL